MHDLVVFGSSDVLVFWASNRMALRHSLVSLKLEMLEATQFFDRAYHV